VAITHINGDKVMTPENLSRRAILAGAASVPALALPAVIAVAAPPALPAAVVAALPAAPDHPVIALADRAIEAWEADGDACDAFKPFDEAMFKWRDKNLRPAKRTLEGRDVSSSTAGLNEMERGLIGIMRLTPADYEEQDRDLSCRGGKVRAAREGRQTANGRHRG
jgi:hypothetical protein